MIIFPAIDLRQGKCVRLLYGQPSAQTTYSDDPAGMALQFANDGAEWLHVVNLDGAFGDQDGANTNFAAIQTILDSIKIPIQVGGGIRSIEDIDRLLNMGVTRVILGTMAVERPRQVLDIIARYGPQQIVVGIDARDGKVAIHGWQDLSELEAVAFGQQMQAMGVTHTVYTDISRDGALTGANVPACEKMGQESGLQVIVSGGVADLNDIHRAKAGEANNLEGVIIGRALYEGSIELSAAIEVANTPVSIPKPKWK